MKVEETGRRTNCLQPGPILLVMFRMLSGGRVAARLLAIRHLLHVLGLIPRRAIPTAALFVAPLQRGRAMLGMDGIGGRRATWGCCTPRHCGGKALHFFFSRRVFG